MSAGMKLLRNIATRNPEPIMAIRLSEPRKKCVLNSDRVRRKIRMKEPLSPETKDAGETLYRQTSVSYVASSLVFFPSSSVTSAFFYRYSGRRGTVAAGWWSSGGGFGRFRFWAA